MPSTSDRAQRFLLVCGGFTVVVAALYFARTVLIPVVLATLLTFILSPVVIMLQRRGFGRIPSVLIVVVLAFTAIVVIGLAVVTELKKLAVYLPAHADEIVEKVADLQVIGKDSWLDSVFSTTDEIRKVLHAGKPAKEAGGAVEPVPVQAVRSPLPLLTSLLGPTVEVVVSALLVLVLLIFMLIQREDLRNRVVGLFGKGSLVRMTKAVDDGMRRISRFLFMQVIVNTGFAVLFAAGLHLIGVPYAVLWGFLAGALRYIPYIGSPIAACLPFLLSVALLPGWSQALAVLGLFLVLELVTWNFLEPLLFGHSVGVSAVALLISAAFWGWLWGPIGLVLSTPLTACLVVIGRHVPQLEFFSVLLGDQPVLERHLLYYQRLLARDMDEAADLVEEYAAANAVGKVYDSILVPALVLAKHNREHDELTQEEEKFIVDATQEIASEVVVPKAESSLDPEDGESSNGAAQPVPARVLVFGCPASDRADELALTLFSRLLDANKCRFEVVSAERLSAEVISRISEEKPCVVCIASLPPSGFAHTRYLCKRLRAHFPEMKILAGCWGLEDDHDRTRKRLTAAGADSVGFRLIETRGQLVPLIQVYAHAPPARCAASSP
jgi:predicted PurR-regulated permease PerM